MKGYQVISAYDGEQALEQYFNNNSSIDLVILDIMLPKMNGFEVLREIRSRSQVPIIMLTAKGSEEDQVNGLKNGADNYLVKPFSNKVLLAHVEAMLRRGKPLLTDEEQIGKMIIDRNTRKVVGCGQELMLTPKEYEVLIYLVDNRELNISREVILDHVWGLSYEGDRRTVDTHIKQLRAKLPAGCGCIKTVHGIGYRFEETNEE